MICVPSERCVLSLIKITIMIAVFSTKSKTYVFSIWERISISATRCLIPSPNIVTLNPSCIMQRTDHQKSTFSVLQKQNFFIVYRTALGGPRESHPCMVLIQPYSFRLTLLTLGIMTIGEYHCCCCRSSLIESLFYSSAFMFTALPKRSHRACTVSASCSRNVIRTTFL